MILHTVKHPRFYSYSWDTTWNNFEFILFPLIYLCEHYYYDFFFVRRGWGLVWDHIARGLERLSKTDVLLLSDGERLFSLLIFHIFTGEGVRVVFEMRALILRTERDGHPPHREVRRTQRLPAVEESSIIRSNESLSLSSTDETRMAGVWYASTRNPQKK